MITRCFVPALLLCSAANAQPFGPREYLDQPYRPWTPIELPAGTPPAPGAYVQVNVNALGLNILGDAANEPSIAVDPTAPLRMAIGWRQFDTVTSNFRQAGFGYSLDGGRTWTASTYNPGLFRSDPVLRCNAGGTLFYNSLRETFDPDMIIAGRIGAPLPLPPIPCPGGDKVWMTIDTRPPGSLGRGNIYMAWNTAGNNYAPNTFTRSTDGGLTYNAPLTLPRTCIFGTLTTGPDGELYIIGQNGSNFSVVRSLNARDPAQTPTFTGVALNLGGPQVLNTPVNPVGLAGQAWIVADTSSGPRRGWVYALCSVNPAGADPLDVTFSRSTDGGVTWSPATRVNPDPALANSYQWFGTMSISPDGRLDVVYNSSEQSLSAASSRTVYTASSDGGFTWSTPVFLTPAWNPLVGYPQQNKIGDYSDMHSDLLGADLTFATTLNGEQDVYYLRIGPRDCNSNGIDDDTDLISFADRDCNGNGIPDSCEITARPEVDADHDGILDACQVCPADFNLDGNLNPDDLGDFITCFFSLSPCPRADFNRDSRIDPDDLGDFITAYFQGCH